MRIVMRVAVGLVGVVAVIATVGWLLPVEHIASRSATFKTPAAAVYAVVADVVTYPTWWSELSQVDVLSPVEGRLRFREHMATGPLVMEVAEATPPSRFVTRIADPDQPFGGTWTFEIASDQGASRLTITERGEVYNPIFRFLSRFVFGYTSTMESFLSALGTKLTT